MYENAGTGTRQSRTGSTTVGGRGLPSSQPAGLDENRCDPALFLLFAGWDNVAGEGYGYAGKAAGSKGPYISPRADVFMVGGKVPC
jgi:hypothetical protein